MTAENRQADRPEPPGSVPGRESPAPRPAACGHALRVLSPTQCLSLLEPGGIGRIGLASAEGVVILPVNFAVTGNAIIFRTAPDTLLAARAGASVSFQTDHIDEALREGWSVLVQGHARMVSDERDVRHLEHATGLEPWAGGARDVWVRIAPARISGRSIQSM